MKTNHHILIFFTCAVLLAVVACSPGIPRATDTAAATVTPKALDNLPPKTGILAFSKFTSEAHTEQDIYTIKTDGTGLALLAHDPGKFLEYPAWSPDGTKIAFQSMTGTDQMTGTYGSSTIWSMNADGSDKLQLIQLPQTGMHPAWSPDGRQIAFCGFSAEDEWLHIFVMNADGSDIHQVTSGIFNDAYMSWARDGMILFMRSTPPNIMGEVYAMNSDGSGMVQLTKSELVRGFAISPDGKSLAVYKGALHQIAAHARNAPGNDILLIDGFADCDDVNLSWSPDGKAIALACSALDAFMGASALTIVNADGSGLKKVMEAGLVFDPDWQH